jgi:small subunit ribosomal protein S10
MCKSNILFLKKFNFEIILFSENPPFFTERWTLLRSKFAKKKYWREYEIRTYYKKLHVNSLHLILFKYIDLFFFQFKHLTGSTADTFLEYVQRNLPEGIMMIVERVKRFSS